MYEELDDSEMSALRDWLAAKRAEMMTERAHPQVHFESVCVGSVWTAKHKGVGTDVAQAHGKSMAATRWAKEHLGNEMASFSLKLYTELVATALANLWADRAEYWYGLYLTAALADTGPTVGQQLASPVGNSVRDVLAGKPDSHPGWKRLRLVLGLSPR